MNHYITRIDNLLKDSSMPPMVMLDGKWGSGKTYFINKHYIPHVNVVRKEEKCLFFSVYGVSTLEDFKDKLLSKALTGQESGSTWFEGVKKSSPLIEKLLSDGNSSFSRIVGGFAGAIKQTYLQNLPNMTLIIDDLERIEKDSLVTEILGECLELAEKQKIKVVIVCNSEQLKNKPLIEKSFVDVVSFCLSDEQAFEVATEQYSDSFCVNALQIIEKVVNNVGMTNIRVLKRVLHRISPLYQRATQIENINLNATLRRITEQVTSICQARYELKATYDDIKKHAFANDLLDFSLPSDENAQTLSQDEEKLQKLLAIAHYPSNEIFDYIYYGDKNIEDDIFKSNVVSLSDPVVNLLRYDLSAIEDEDDFEKSVHALKSIIFSTTERVPFSTWFAAVETYIELHQDGFLALSELQSQVKKIDRHISNISFTLNGGRKTEPDNNRDLLMPLITKARERLFAQVKSNKIAEFKKAFVFEPISVLTSREFKLHYQTTPLLTNIEPAFFLKVMPNWSHRDLLCMADYWENRYRMSNVEDYFKDDLDGLKILSEGIKEIKLNGQLKMGSLQKLKNEIDLSLDKITVRLNNIDEAD
ncbi:P-loop NTPase fold protein [Pseudoalteromonas piscicida]|uniref:P-loop NTPase fold protein n=1 Tax=Pseudoalteromonas piscicida TaxID=43662 RepID=UPI0005FA814C|nr:P-loop NTPase fold protein [Pseudoalteromonas piscicida]KJZ03418.1 hypothetical protein TW73_08220 [Pseudoalteromonas piscicida]